MGFLPRATNSASPGEELTRKCKRGLFPWNSLDKAVNSIGKVVSFSVAVLVLIYVFSYH